MQANQEGEGLEVIELQPISVHSQKCCRHCHRGAFVAIHERMILRKTLPKCSRFLNEVVVITTLRSRQSRLQGSAIRTPTEPPNLAINRAWTAITRQRSDRRSLSQAAEQFWVLVDELINRREKR